MECRQCKYATNSEHQNRIWCVKHRKNVMSTYSKCQDATNLTATAIPGCPGGLCGDCALLAWPTCEPIKRQDALRGKDCSTCIKGKDCTISAMTECDVCGQYKKC